MTWRRRRRRLSPPPFSSAPVGSRRSPSIRKTKIQYHIAPSERGPRPRPYAHRRGAKRLRVGRRAPFQSLGGTRCTADTDANTDGRWPEHRSGRHAVSGSWGAASREDGASTGDGAQNTVGRSSLATSCAGTAPPNRSENTEQLESEVVRTVRSSRPPRPPRELGEVGALAAASFRLAERSPEISERRQASQRLGSCRLAAKTRILHE